MRFVLIWKDILDNKGWMLGTSAEQMEDFARTHFENDTDCEIFQIYTNEMRASDNYMRAQIKEIQEIFKTISVSEKVK